MAFCAKMIPNLILALGYLISVIALPTTTIKHDERRDCRGCPVQQCYAVYGPPGPRGLPGPAFPGPSGSAGPIGPMGPTGPSGPAGPIGIQGVQGVQGPIGLTGLQGPPGPTGIIGLSGPTGLQGAQGPVGEIGQQGIQGIQGIQGLIGPSGPSGPRGPTGPIGPIGPSGPAGEIGPSGLRGPQGPTGPVGPSGESGLTPTIRYGYLYGIYSTVTTFTSGAPIIYPTFAVSNLGLISDPVSGNGYIGYNVADAGTYRISFGVQVDSTTADSIIAVEVNNVVVTNFKISQPITDSGLLFGEYLAIVPANSGIILRAFSPVPIPALQEGTQNSQMWFDILRLF